MGKHFTALEREEIAEMNREGYTHREIGERLGYSREQIKAYFKRLHKKVRTGTELEVPKRRGRPRSTPLSLRREKELRIKELEREVQLLRSFLHACGRG